MSHTNTGAGVPLTERIAEAVPGTEAYRATHGVTGAHAAAQGLKAHVPGTEEHRMHEAGVIGGHHGTGGGILGGTGTGAHHQGGGASIGERVAAAIPGTQEYEATHGMTSAHRGVEQGKAMVPGTEEHHMRTSTEPGHGAGLSGLTGGHHHTTGEGHHHTTGTGVAAGTGLLGGEGMHTAGQHTGMGATGHADAASEPLGTKIKKHIPGTREHEEKKVAEGRF